MRQILEPEPEASPEIEIEIEMEEALATEAILPYIDIQQHVRLHFAVQNALKLFCNTLKMIRILTSWYIVFVLLALFSIYKLYNLFSPVATLQDEEE